MRRFKLGDSLLSLTSSTGIGSQPREKWKIYEVKHISYCIGCGRQFINIGPRTAISGAIGCNCGSTQNDFGMYWTDSGNFIKADSENLQQVLQEFIDNQNYEKAAELRDFLLTSKNEK